MVVAVKEHRIAYMPVPKAACSSVKATLALLDPDVDVSLDEMSKDNKAIHKIYPTMRFRPHRWEGYENWWKFTVIRDPLKRLLAVYTDRVVAKQELHNSPKLKAQTEFSIEPDPDFFFQNLKSYMRLSSTVKHHALPTRLFVGPKPLRYDHVFTTSQLDLLAEALSEQTGQTVTIPRFNSSKEQLELSGLQPKTQATLKDILLEEYDHLSDFFENPFG